MQQAENMAKLAKQKNVIVNTVAMMDTKVKGPLIHLAKETGGDAKYIDAKGKINPLVE